MSSLWEAWALYSEIESSPTRVPFYRSLARTGFNEWPRVIKLSLFNTWAGASKGLVYMT